MNKLLPGLLMSLLLMAIAAGTTTTAYADSPYYDDDGYYVNPNGSNATETTLSIDPETSTYGQTVTFTATLSGQEACTCGGLYIVLDGEAIAQTDSISTDDYAEISTTISDMPAGTHTVYAEFRPWGLNEASHSDGIATVIAKATTSAAVSVSSGTAGYGTDVTLTANLSSEYSGGDAPSGTVTFYSDGTEIATANVSSTTPSAVVSNLALGTHTITVEYSGDDNYDAVSAADSTSADVEIDQATTATSLEASPSEADYGTSVTLTATVAPEGSGGDDPTGTVTFTDTTTGTDLGSADLEDGTAAVTISNFAVGTHDISVSYSGDDNYESSTDTTSVIIDAVDTDLSLSASSPKINYGASLELTVSLDTNGSTETATGTVIFYDDGTDIGEATLSGDDATLDTSTLSVGTHSITAEYSGDDNFSSATSNSVTITVENVAPSVSSLSPATGPTVGGTTVTITGENLDNVTGVTFDGTAASSFTINSATEITVITPEHTAGAVNVVLASSYGDVTLSDAFSYTTFDPSQDATVRKIVQHQVSSTIDAATDQMDSVQDRMAQLNACSDTTAKKGDTQDREHQSRCALPKFQQGITLSASTDDTPVSVHMPGISTAAMAHALSFWTSGSVAYHRTKASDTSAYSFTTSGLTLGADTAVNDALHIGGAIGVGYDRSKIDDYGSRTRSVMTTGQLYGTMRFMPHTYLSMSMGYAHGNILSDRYDETADAIASGRRDGESAFASISVSRNMHLQELFVAPYLRADVQRVRLGAYSESGAGMDDLTYDKLYTTATSLSIGTRVSYPAIVTPIGAVSPALKVAYKRIFDADYTQALSFVGDGSTTYSLADTIAGQNQGSIDLSLSLKPSDQTMLSLGYALAVSEDAQSQGLKVVFAAKF